MANVALPVPCVPMRTIEAWESKTLRHSRAVIKEPGFGVEFLELGKLRCFSAGGDGVGSGFWPSILTSPAFIAA